MSYSYTSTQTSTFTVTHARHLAAKVAADLKRMQRFYDEPSDKRIERYEREVIELMKGGYLKSVSYGFKRNGKWIPPQLTYTARDLASEGVNDDPGGVQPDEDVAGARFYSYLRYSRKWERLSQDEKEAVRNSIPVERGTAKEPGTVGYYHRDRTYSAGGRALERGSLRSH